MSIKNLQKSIHKDNLEAGWWDEKPASYATNTATSIALMHMELSKALEIVRKGGFVDFERISHKIKELSEEKNNDDMLVKISLMHSELSEALEYHISDEYDSHLPNRKGEEVELADLVIRLLDYAEKKGYDIESAISEKREYNKSRKDHSKESRSQKTGKQF